jgi:hypothetical protein
VPLAVGETTWLPEVAFAPLQLESVGEAEAVQEVALVLLHVRVELEPELIVEGEAEIAMVGA